MSAKLRSSTSKFDIKNDCLFCGEEASIRKETKKEMKYRRVVHQVETISFQNTLLNRAQERNDEWGEKVCARVLSVKDLIAAEAKFHHPCSLKFFTNGKTSHFASFT